MKLLPLAQEVLVNVLDKNVPFSLAVKNCFKYKVVDKNERSIVTALVGCSLRHYIVFDYHIKNTFGELTNIGKSGLLLALADTLFIKKFNHNDIISLAEDSLEKDLRGKVEPFLTSLTTDNLIPEDISRQSVEYLSLRFNTPLWMVKMWNKYYGYKFTYKILKANSKPSSMSCRINTSKISQDDFLNKYKDDFKSTPYSDMVEYVGNVTLGKSKAYSEQEVFPFSYALKYMMDEIDADSLRGIAIYNGYSNHIYLDLMARYSCFYSADIVCGTTQALFDTRKQVERYALKNVNIYDCPASGILTCISRPVHTFIVLPFNSNFAMLRSTPDYFLRVNQSMYDSLLKGEAEALEEACDSVEDNGQLIYAIPTLSNKEGHGIVESFLSKHKEFVLVDEKQFFPFDPYDYSLYYAIMKKEGSL